MKIARINTRTCAVMCLALVATGTNATSVAEISHVEASTQVDGVNELTDHCRISVSAIASRVGERAQTFVGFEIGVARMAQNPSGREEPWFFGPIKILVTGSTVDSGVSGWRDWPRISLTRLTVSGAGLDKPRMAIPRQNLGESFSDGWLSELDARTVLAGVLRGPTDITLSYVNEASGEPESVQIPVEVSEGDKHLINACIRLADRK